MLPIIPPMVPALARRRLVATAGPTVVGALTAALVVLARPARTLAHGGADDVQPPLDVTRALAAWSFDPLVVAGLLTAAGLYLAAVRSVGRAHPRTPVPRRRIAAWLGGLAVIGVALQSSLDVYATTLFSVHMVQHLLLAMIAAPLLALGAPITVALRAARPDVRRRYLLPLLHSRPVKVLAFPVVSWMAFAGVMWVSHFSALFDAALEQPLIHQFEHALFLGSAMLFW